MGRLVIVASCIGVEGVDRFTGTTTAVTATVVPPVPVPATPTPMPGTVPAPYVPDTTRDGGELAYTGSRTG